MGKRICSNESCKAVLVALEELLTAEKNGANLERYYDDEIDELWEQAEEAIRKARKEK